MNYLLKLNFSKSESLNQLECLHQYLLYLLVSRQLKQTHLKLLQVLPLVTLFFLKEWRLLFFALFCSIPACIFNCLAPTDLMSSENCGKRINTNCTISLRQCSAVFFNSSKTVHCKKTSITILLTSHTVYSSLKTNSKTTKHYFTKTFISKHCTFRC